MIGPERIVAAAVTVYGAVVSLPPPARHHTILAVISQLNPGISCGPRSQGFLTSTGRYVGRIEAAQIAVEAGQIEAPEHGPQLFSEDLW